MPRQISPYVARLALLSCGAVFSLAILASSVIFSTSASAQPPRDSSANGSPARPVVTNSIGMQLVEIPAGEFQMGSEESVETLRRVFNLKSDRPVDDERPVHRVRITRPFFLGKFEVTVGEFRQFVAATSHRTDAETDGTGSVAFNGKTFSRNPELTWSTWWKEQTDRHPVVNVSPNDAAAFCRWLSKKEGKTYRLPTEAQWEYACRAGTTTRFSSGDDAAAAAKAGNFADPRMHPPGTVLTTEVGRFAPNPFGLYDMHGNVWEWCADHYQTDYYAHSPTFDPTGPARGGNVTLRGGCWGFGPSAGRSASRGRSSPTARGYRDGFRVVLELVQPRSDN
jgi:formylglycine-generating enzyme